MMPPQEAVAAKVHAAIALARARADGEVGRLREALGKVTAELQIHHDWHLRQGTCWAPTNENADTDFVSWDGADAYASSDMCEQTEEALSIARAALARAIQLAEQQEG